MMGTAWRDAWRSLARRRAFFAASVLTLACGTGITTAVFSLIDTVLIKPLPYPEADRLVTLFESSPTARDKTSLIAPARLEDWQRLNGSFVAVAGSYSENVTDTSGAEPERLEGRRVTPRFFAVYAAPPRAGRYFTAEEEGFNGPGAAVISERLWSRRFGRDPAAIGRVLTIGGRSHAIVGVAPATFTSATTDVWLPAQLSPGLLRIREARFLVGIGRLRPGVTAQAAAGDLARVQEALGRQFPRSDEGTAAQVTPLKEVRIGTAGRGLTILFAAVAALWLIALANIAGLTLVQARRRARELAIRTALGASRARVIGAMVREGTIVAAAGGTLGAALAGWMVFAMPAVLEKTPRINELVLDWRALLFAAATTALAAAALGLIPALAGSRARLTGVLGSATRGSTGGRHRLQQVLVVAQVALSVVLVGSATVLLRGYYQLAHAETGFDPSGVMTFHVGARWDEDRARIGQLQAEVVAALEDLPHVRAVGTTSFLPSTGATLRYQVAVEGLAGPNRDGTIDAGMRMIGGQYLAALGGRLMAGAWCPPLPGTAPAVTARAAIVNQRFVERHAAGQDLVGRTLRIPQFPAVALIISGVVADVLEDGAAAGAAPYVYTCEPAGAWPDPEYVVRTSDPRAFAADLRRVVKAIDPTRAVFGVRSMEQVLESALDQPRLDAALLGLFAGAALTLAAVGLYSLFMLVVSERSREMAVRLALGAAPRALFRSIMSDAGRLWAAGAIAGVVLLVTADRVLRSVLTIVGPVDPRSVAAAIAVLGLVSAAAVLGPALRAARVAPSDALRIE